MTIGLKKRIDGTKAQQSSEAHAFALAVKVREILAAKRAAKA